MKLLISILALIHLSACANLSSEIPYNPEKLPIEKLSTIESSSKKSMFDAYFYIRWIEGVWAEDMGGSKFTKIPAGVHIVDWVKTEIDDMGFASVRREVARGSLVINLDPQTAYELGVSQVESQGAEVRSLVDQRVVSQYCKNPNDCEKIKLQVLENTNSNK